jgi:hypothetical protein
VYDRRERSVLQHSVPFENICFIFQKNLFRELPSSRTAKRFLREFKWVKLKICTTERRWIKESRQIKEILRKSNS